MCGTEMLQYLAFDFFGQFLGCYNNAVGRGDGWGCEVFVSVENCDGDACGASVFHPHGQGAVVIK